jgi:uncharacterized protein DUF1573
MHGIDRLRARPAGALLLSVVACSSKGRHDAPAAPHITCDAASYDFGQTRQGSRLKHTFRLRNTGSAPLRIERVDYSYSCVAVNPPERVAPGEGADLEVACDTDNRSNRLVDKLVIHSDDPLLPQLELKVEASVEPLLGLTSRTVELKTPFGRKDSQEVRLTGALATQARLELEMVDPPGPQVTILAAEPGRPQGLRLTLAGSRVGRTAGRVQVRTGLEKPKDLTLLYSGQVFGDLTVDPTNPYIDLRAAGPIGIVVKVSSRRPDFRLDDARVVTGPFEASFTRDEATRDYSVRVRVVEGRLAEGQRGLLGTLRLISNDPAESRKDVPLFALGEANRAP